MRRVGYRGIGIPTVAATLLLLMVAAGCSSGSDVMTPERLEEIAQGIDRSLMCPVCPSETIDQSQVALAKQMRAMVRDKLAQGESRQEILDFFVERYGTSILAEPPQEGFNLLVWVIPPIALLAGGAILAAVVMGMRRTRPAPVVVEGERLTGEGLEPFLALVDEEIRRITPETAPPVEESREEPETKFPDNGGTASG